MTEPSSDKVLRLDNDSPVKYIGHGKVYAKAILKDGKIFFIDPKENDEQVDFEEGYVGEGEL